MIVLVTGASGFLGGRVARRLLADGHEVRAFVRAGRRLDLVRAVRVEGDLCRTEDITRALDGVEAVVHCGALVKTTGRQEEFEAANVEATREIIAGAGSRPVVHVSSLSVYDIGKDGETIDEEGAYESGAGDRGFYSQTKLAADRLAMESAAAGAPVTVVRPGVLYGPDRRPPLGRQSFALGKVRVILGSGDYLLPLAHVDNVTDAIAAALATPRARGRAYTIVDPQIPLHDYLAIYRSITGERWRPLFVAVWPLLPAVTAAGVVFRGIGRRPPVTAHQLRRATWSARFDTSRARSELAWSPRILLAEGLRQSVGAVAAEGGNLTPVPVGE